MNANKAAAWEMQNTETLLPFLWQQAFHLVVAQFNSPYGTRTVNGCCTRFPSLEKVLVM